jgi:hypothetical protein
MSVAALLLQLPGIALTGYQAIGLVDRHRLRNFVPNRPRQHGGDTRVPSGFFEQKYFSGTYHK